jgi:hypothetical protein
MTHTLSSDDRRFRDEFEACRLAPERFDHRAHVRLAYIYLAEHDDEAAVARMREALQRFIRYQGIDAAKYHETLTRAWVLAVRHFMRRTPVTSSAEAFIAASPALLDRGVMMSHYSRDVLFSDDARGRFVAPDLEPIT